MMTMKMMNESKFTSKKPTLQKTEADRSLILQKRREKRNQTRKLKKLMKKRLIIRNLSFQVSEEKLKEVFSKFGEVLDINMPLNSEGKKRGFAFIRYKDTKSQVQAMKAMNFKKIAGRPIAIDFAVDKTTYQTRLQNVDPESSEKVSKSESLSESEESEMEDENPKIKEKSFSNETNYGNEQMKNFLKEFNADIDEQSDADIDEQSNESFDESSEEEHLSDDAESQHSHDLSSTDKLHIKKQSDDVSEGKTVFIRNISFKNSEEDLQELMQEYGETMYCLVCVDPLTDFPKGTAFVKFKEKESADRLIEDSLNEPGILLDGRKLLCTHAVSREDILKMKEHSPKLKDKRNLRLLKCGLIMQGSEEAEGVSQTDMAKRTQLELMKKQKLKNVNFFVSDVRLVIHNLPKTVTDKDLRVMFKKAAGKDAVIKEARVMIDFKKTDAQGYPVSRGFGFVSFTRHEDALKALTEINNNPSVFTFHKRPIVEFSVENKVALLAQKRKKEKVQMKNKKRMEEKFTRKNEVEQITERQTVQKANFFNRKKGKDKPKNKLKQCGQNVQQHVQATESKKKQSKSKKKQGRRKFLNKQEHQNLSQMANKYKNKLLQKL